MAEYDLELVGVYYTLEADNYPIQRPFLEFSKWKYCNYNKFDDMLQKIWDYSLQNLASVYMHRFVFISIYQRVKLSYIAKNISIIPK